MVSVIIVAAGSSSRMGTDKLMLDLCRMTVLERSAAAFDLSYVVDEIIVATKSENIEKYIAMLSKYAKVKAVVAGGATRTQSVKNAIAAVSENADIIAVHDGARPLVTDEIISAAIEGARLHGAAAAGIKAVDTIKIVDGGGGIVETLDREKIVQIQTPQAFRADILRRAYESGRDATDDCALVESLGVKVYVTKGSRENLKLTEPCDVAFAKAILKERESFECE